MSDISFDLYMHVLLLLYKKVVERRIIDNEHKLPDGFWDL